LNTTYVRTLKLRSEQGTHEIGLEYGRDGHHFRHAGLDTRLAVDGAAGSHLIVRLGERTLAADVVRCGDELHVFVAGRHQALTLVDVVAHAAEHGGGHAGLTAPMPGRVIAVHAARGERVAEGAPLLVMEAMKMEHAIVAPADGTVDEVLYEVGDQVAEGAALVSFSPSE
jgi:3-methylcrotonyl-CoA carboxylase alpha subunit